MNEYRHFFTMHYLTIYYINIKKFTEIILFYLYELIYCYEKAQSVGFEELLAVKNLGDYG